MCAHRHALRAAPAVSALTTPPFGTPGLVPLGVVGVIRDYGMYDWAGAPEESRTHHAARSESCPFGPHPRRQTSTSGSPGSTLSSVLGKSRTRTLVALNTALATAAPAPQ